MNQKTRSLALLTLGCITLQSQCFAGINVEAGTFQIGHCEYQTRASISINGKEARRLYKTLEGIPEADEADRLVKRTSTIECSLSKSREDYSCSLMMKESGEILAPLRQEPQQEQQQTPERPAAQMPQTQAPQQQQQQQCDLMSILFE